MTATFSRRAALALAPAAAMTALASSQSTVAEAKASRLAPAFHRRRVGDAVVTTLLDGYLDIAPEWWTNLPADALASELEAAFLPSDRPVRISVNAYVVETEGRVIAIDAGARDLFGPTAGRHAEVLAQAGVDPAAIDTVLLTHMHPDHIGGLLDGGAPRFPNATIVAQAIERDYWISAAEQARAPEFAAPWFDAAAAVVAAYGDRFTVARGEASVAPGLTAVDLAGHTPGHVGYLLESAGARLFFWADVSDQLALQLNAPERGLIFDIDADRAVAARRKAFDLAAAERLMIAGSHVPFPSFGHIAIDRGAYRFAPADWAYEI